MPMNTPPKRKLLHTRQISCNGYEREDGLWDIEALLTDVKTYDILHHDGTVKLAAGTPLHQISLGITVDSSLVIVDAKARTERGPHRECPAINEAYTALKGMTIGAGFTNRVKKHFKGAGGCTHLTELIGTVATTAYQTLWPVLEKRYAARDSEEGGAPAAGAPAEKPSPTIDSCHALRRDGEVVLMRWPKFYHSSRLQAQQDVPVLGEGDH
jgi:hypothetical protein